MLDEKFKNFLVLIGGSEWIMDNVDHEENIKNVLREELPMVSTSSDSRTTMSRVEDALTDYLRLEGVDKSKVKAYLSIVGKNNLSDLVYIMDRVDLITFFQSCPSINVLGRTLVRQLPQEGETGQVVGFLKDFIDYSSLGARESQWLKKNCEVAEFTNGGFLYLRR